MKIMREAKYRNKLEEAYAMGYRLGHQVGGLEKARQFLDLEPLTYVEKQILAAVMKAEMKGR